MSQASNNRASSKVANPQAARRTVTPRDSSWIHVGTGEERLRADAMPMAAVAPLFPGKWHTLDDHRTGQALDHLAASMGPGWGTLLPTSREHTNVRVLPLSCYPGASMVEVITPVAAAAYAVWNLFCWKGHALLVDGKSRWVHALNAGAILHDDMHSPEGIARAANGEAVQRFGLPPFDVLTGAEYLKFFGGVVWGDRGPFRIVEELSDPVLAPARCERSRLHEAVGPVRCRTHTSGILAEAAVLYDGSLFRAEFRIEQNGIVEMLKDEPLASGLLPSPIIAPPLRRIELIEERRQ